MIRIRIGWKLSKYLENENEKSIAQYVFVVNPFANV